VRILTPKAGMLALSACLVHASHGLAEPLSLTVSGSGGWTSNAGGDAFAQASTFTTSAATLEGTARTPDSALRGSIGFSHTRFQDAEYENDLGIEARLDAEHRLNPTTILRGSLNLQLNREGSVLDLGGVGLITETDTRVGRIAGEIATSWQEIELTADIGVTDTAVGKTRFEGLPIDAQRLDPDTRRFSAGLRAAYPLAQGVSLLGGIDLDRLQVSPADQARFLRSPATRLRATAGTRVGNETASVSARGGMDFLRADGPGLARMLPYASVDARYEPAADLALNTEISAASSLDQPFDGVADYILGAGLGAEWAPLPTTTLAAVGTAEQSRSVLSGARTEIRYKVQTSAAHRFSDLVTGRIELGYIRSGLPDSFVDERRIEVALDAKI